MKITRLKLTGAIGIKHAMNRDEIEIKFGDNRITMLTGGNASGKSTIASHLHPFKSSFDDRQTSIIEGGSKEIDIEHNGHTYEIVHYYKRSGAKSFIKKDGVELNENGGVRTVEQIIETELGVNQDYFKIGKIGSNTSSFIQFTTAERKTYISKFLPDIDGYLKKSEIIRKKFLRVSDLIKQLSSNLEKYSDKEVIELEISETVERLKKIKENKNKLGSLIGATEERIESLKRSLEEYENLEKLNESVSTLEEEIETMKITVEEFLEEYGDKSIDDLNKYIDENTDIFNKKNTEFEVLKSDIKSKRTDQQNAKNDIETLGLRLEGLEKQENLDELKKEKSDKEEKLKELKKESSEYLPEFKVREGLTTDLSKFNTFKNFIIKYHSDLASVNPIVDERDSIIEILHRDGMEMRLKTRANENRKLIESTNEIITRKKARVEMKSEEILASEYYTEDKKKEYRDNFPGIDRTRMYEDSFKHLDAISEIKELEKEIKEHEASLSDLEIQAEDLERIKDINSEFRYYIKELEGNTGKILLEKEYGNISSVVKNRPTETERILNELSETLDSIVFKIDEERKIQNDIDKLKVRIERVENSSKLVQEIESQKKRAEEKYKTLETELSEDLESYKTYVKELTELRDSLKSHRNYREYKTNYGEKTKKLNELRESIKKVNSLNESLEVEIEKNREQTELREAYFPREKEAEDKLLELKVALSEQKNLSENIKKQTELYEELKVLRSALDPNSGIPLIFIQAYLDRTRDIANDLLSDAFKDNKFEIDFVTGERDFFIRVRSGDNVKNDISEASQGELALTTISINLALIEQSVGDYNILVLDEIDGPLDSGNRTNFLNIINKQIARLDIEQVFVISHNDAFDTEPMDLILLDRNNTATKGASFFSNKQVIFDSSKD